MAKVVQLRPLAIGFWDNAAWGSSGTPPDPPGGDAGRVDPLLPVPSHDDATSFINASFAGGTGHKISFTLRDVPNDILSVTSVQCRVRHRFQNHFTDLRMFARTGTTDYNVSTLARTDTAAWGTGGDDARTVVRAWTPTEISDGLEVGVFVEAYDPTDSDAAVEITSLWIQLTYEPFPPQDDAVRDTASRRQWFFARPPVTMKRRLLELPDALEIGLNERVNVSHADGPDVAGLGWRSAQWQRRFTRQIGRVIDPNTNTVEMELEDIRGQLCLCRYSMRALTPSAIADGVAFFAAGATLEHMRASWGWAADQSGGHLLKRAEDDQPRYGLALMPASGTREDGLIVENTGINHLLRSSYVNGLTGWTTAGATGTVAVDTTKLRFDAVISPQSAKMTAGVTHTADLTHTSTVTASLAGNKVIALQMHTQNAGTATAGPNWSLQRGVDSFWFTAGGGWGASKVQNAIASSEDDWLETYETDIDVGASGTTLKLEYTVPSTFPDSSEYWIGHSQNDDHPHPSSPIVTEATTFTRAADQTFITNDSGKRSFNAARGTLVIQHVPNYRSDTATDHQILQVFHDANNVITLRWDTGNARWELEWEGATVVVTAFLATPAPVRGVKKTFVFRWTSASDGELDLPARTLDFFVDGTKGTGAVYTALVETATSDIKLELADGTLSQLQSYAFVMTDEEAQRLPRQ